MRVFFNWDCDLDGISHHSAQRLTSTTLGCQSHKLKSNKVTLQVISQVFLFFLCLQVVIVYPKINKVSHFAQHLLVFQPHLEAGKKMH